MENVISLNSALAIIVGNFIIYTYTGYFIGREPNKNNLPRTIALIVTNVIYAIVLVLLAIAESNNYSQ